MNRLVDIKSMDLEELSEYMSTFDEQKFRGKQIFNWIHEKNIISFKQMTNISKDMINRLETNCELITLKEIDTISSKEDGTKKFLFKLLDDQVIESVLMKYKYGNSVCISSQVGCKMGCKFCASAIGGIIRNLRPSEMLDQIYGIERETSEKISNIVVMGTGEPFDNYENLMKFIKIINSKEGKNIGQRNITVSTCGIVPKIYEFADENIQVNLAISLHAPNDDIRRKLMPVSNKYSFEELMKSIVYYIERTNRRVTFEYSLIKGTNDSKEAALLLSQKLKGMLCHVNLIPVNRIEGREFNKSDEQQIFMFKKMLEKNNIQTTVRRTLGEDVNAACGQLRRKYYVEK